MYSRTKSPKKLNILSFLLDFIPWTPIHPHPLLQNNVFWMTRFRPEEKFVRVLFKQMRVFSIRHFFRPQKNTLFARLSETKSCVFLGVFLGRKRTPKKSTLTSGSKPRPPQLFKIIKKILTTAKVCLFFGQFFESQICFCSKAI